MAREFKGRSLIGFPESFCVVDIETTGLNSVYDDIIEIGAIKYENGVAVGTFSSLLQPKVSHFYGRYVSPFITELTGITNEMLDSAPQAEETLQRFCDFLGDSIIVGYNVNFDVNFLYEAFDDFLGIPLKNDFIDIMRMAKRLYPDMEHHRLSDMVRRFGLVNEHAHRALSDCEVTAQCFEEFKTEAQIQYGTAEEYILSYPHKSRMI